MHDTSPVCPGFQDLPETERHPYDAVCLVKQFMSSTQLSHMPLLSLPLQNLKKLQSPKPTTAIPTKTFNDKTLNEFRKTAAAIEKSPFDLVEGSNCSICEAFVIGQKKVSIQPQRLCHCMSFPWRIFNAMKKWEKQGLQMASRTLRQELRSEWKCTAHVQISQKKMPMGPCVCPRLPMLIIYFLLCQQRPLLQMRMKLCLVR